MDFDKEMSGFNAHYANELKKIELESMYFNKVWDLIETLEGIKPIKCE